MPDTNFFREIWGRRMNSETGFIAKGATTEDVVAEQKARPLMDDFWRSKHPDLTKITVPTYAVASWATAGLHTRGSVEGFKYSKALTGLTDVWTPEALNEWLTDPRKYLKGTKMSAKTPKIADRANLVAYLASIGG